MHTLQATLLISSILQGCWRRTSVTLTAMMPVAMMVAAGMVAAAKAVAAGFTVSAASFQYFAGTTTQPRTFWYFGPSIDLYFQASGGTGSYTFQVFPYISSVGTATYQGGPGSVTTAWHPDPTNPGGFVQSGASATFEDAPGIPFYVPTNGLAKLISASVTWYGTTIAWVTSRGVTVSCGTVYWTATVSVEADAVMSIAGYLFSGETSVNSYTP
jgi:hypothetical protein